MSSSTTITVFEIASENNYNLSDSNLANGVSQFVETIITQIVSLSNRIRKHKHNSVLKAKDINEALRSKKLPVLLGYCQSETREYVHIGDVDNQEILAYDDKKINLSDLVHLPLKEYPQDRLFDFHWLAYVGIQPQIEQNLTEPISNPKPPNKLLSLEEEMKLSDQNVLIISSKTVLPQTLQAYFISSTETIKTYLNSPKDSGKFNNLLEALSTETSVQPLLPFYLNYIREIIMNNSKNQHCLNAALYLTKALFSNQSLEKELFLLTFVTIPITLMLHNCIIYNEPKFNDFHELKLEAVDFLGLIIDKWKHRYPTLEQRIAEFLITIIFETRHNMTTQFGAVLGLQCIDPEYIRQLLIPNLPSLLATIRHKAQGYEPSLRFQASHLYGALLRICGICFHSDSFDVKNHPEYQEVYNTVVSFFGNDFLSYCSN